MQTLRRRSNRCTALVRVVAASAILTSFAAGCGGDDTATPPTTATPPPTSDATPASEATADEEVAPPDTVAAPAALADPCELVNRDEASTLTGLAMDEGVQSETVDTRTCRYNAPTSGPVGQVEVYVGEGTEQILSTDQRLGHALTEVPGIGDEALEKDMHIFFRVDQTWYLIRVVRMVDSSGLVEPLRAAATTAVGRL